MKGKEDVWKTFEKLQSLLVQKKMLKYIAESDLNGKTETCICVARKQALRTNYLKHYFDKSADRPLCITCRGEG